MSIETSLAALVALVGFWVFWPALLCCGLFFCFLIFLAGDFGLMKYRSWKSRRAKRAKLVQP